MSKLEQKILYVTRPLQSPWDEASKVFAYDLARNVDGHDVTVMTHGYVDNVPENVVQKSIYTSNSFTLWQRIRMLAWLALNARKYDTIHLLFTPTKFNSFILRHLLPRNAHVIQTIATIRRDLYKSSEYKKVFFGDTLVTYSLYAQNILMKAGFNNVTQIYPGVDLEKYHPTDRDEDLVQEWDIKLNDFVVVYPGEFVRLGATDVIVDAFLELWSDPANAHIKYLCACRIKGSPDEVKKSEVRERIRTAGHLDKVIFSDTFVGNMNRVYNLADLVIFPVVSMKGKFDVPLAMVEPYACKKVVVASDLLIFREFSTDDINVVIPRNSSAHIAHAILSIYQNRTAHVRRGEEAYNFIHRHFDIKEIGRSYGELYRHIHNI